MTNRAFDTIVPRGRQQPSSLTPGPLAAPPRFHEVLRDSGEVPLQSLARLSPSSWPYRQKSMRKQKIAKPGTLTRALSWMKKQYPAIPEKRMRVAETIPLGEKRFVALVTVDGREFLIGGGASSVSLLSQWESGTQIPVEDDQALPMMESFE
ncbi:MAG: flagellar biosynthetic protein FliO [Terracidiphilus sp.]